MPLNAHRSNDAWIQGLSSAGFHPQKNGLQDSRGFMADIGESWVTIRQPPAGENCVLPQDENPPGFWKLVADPNGGKRYEFQVPASVAGCDCHDLQDEDDPVRSCIAWAISTANGQLPDGWQAPPKAIVEAWVPEGGLSVQRGPFAVQGALICEPNQLKLSFPLVQGIPEALSEQRKAWIRQTLRDAHNRWRLARIVATAETDQRGAAVEIDLSGAPPLLMEELFVISLDTLRWVAAWLIWPMGFLADPNVKSDVWESSPELISGDCRDEQS